MVRIMKPNRVVVVLTGRYAGRKAVIVRNVDDGTNERGYGHALVAGVERYPRPITKSMAKSKKRRRSKIKVFVKHVNYHHVMPTRYSVDIPFEKTIVSTPKVNDPSQRKKCRALVKKLFEERYKTGKNRWFFTKLRF